MGGRITTVDEFLDTTKVDEAVWAYRLSERLAPSEIAERRLLKATRRLNKKEWQEYVRRTVDRNQESSD